MKIVRTNPPQKVDTNLDFVTRGTVLGLKQLIRPEGVNWIFHKDWCAIDERGKILAEESGAMIVGMKSVTTVNLVAIWSRLLERPGCLMDTLRPGSRLCV
jgi:hypothetical protein